MDACEVPRWQLLKSTIDNLAFEPFEKGYKNDPNAVCLDVRTSEEFSIGSLDNAKNLSYLSNDLVELLEALDISKKYFDFCRTERRSIRVCVLMKNLGYKVVDLDKGIKDHL